jgi:hypothetical protein
MPQDTIEWTEKRCEPRNKNRELKISAGKLNL